jgi:hypothetical protein
MREFIKIHDFINWFIHNCDEPFPIAQMHREFEACIWMPVDYLTNILSPASIDNLREEVVVVEEIQLQA